jgi:hypothetical protein
MSGTAVCHWQAYYTTNEQGIDCWLKRRLLFRSRCSRVGRGEEAVGIGSWPEVSNKGVRLVTISGTPSSRLIG